MDTSSLPDSAILWNKPGNARPAGGYLRPLFPHVWLKDAPNLTTLLTQLDNRFEQGRFYLDVLRASHLIALAVGTDLDDLGAIFGVPRLAGELDAQYRIRIPATVQNGVSASTIPNMTTFLTAAFGVPVQVRDSGPGSFAVTILGTVAQPSIVVPVINTVKAAGTQFTAGMLTQLSHVSVTPRFGAFRFGQVRVGVAGIYLPVH